MRVPTIIQGHAVRDGAAVPAADVRLLDCSGEFADEVRAGPKGDFRFATGPGTWTVRALGAGGAGGCTVTVGPDDVEVEVTLALAPPALRRA
jgi:hypothetical protein